MRLFGLRIAAGGRFITVTQFLLESVAVGKGSLLRAELIGHTDKNAVPGSAP
jgi:hypothetical protein